MFSVDGCHRRDFSVWTMSRRGSTDYLNGKRGRDVQGPFPLLCGTRLVSGTRLIKITALPFVSWLKNYVHVDINSK